MTQSSGIRIPSLWGRRWAKMCFANQSGTAGRTVSEEAVFIVLKSIRSILVAECGDRRENKG
jgi:hypothetical protein